MRRLALAAAAILVAGACSGASPEGAVPQTAQTEDTTLPADASGPTTTTLPSPTASPETTAAPAAEAASGSCWSAAAAGGSDGITFADITEEAGLVDPLTGMRAHAAAWSDVNGDLLPDLVVGTFATARPDIYQERGADGPSPDRLLTTATGGFTIDAAFPDGYGRTSGAAFVDLDGDGDDDLVLSRNVRERDTGGAATEVLENTGAGFVAVAASGLDAALGGRSIGVLDADGDGLLDLLVLEDRYRGGNSRLYRNRGASRSRTPPQTFSRPASTGWE